jgi:Cys-rich protein (TIGR01571 family)
VLHLLEESIPSVARSVEGLEKVVLAGQQKVQQGPVGALIMVLGELLLVALFAYLYRENRELPALNKKSEQPDLQDWTEHWYSCLSDMRYCLMGCFCPCVRWAETISLVKGLLPFWTAFLINFLLVVLVGIPALGLVGQVFLCLLCVSYRQQIREKFNFKEKGGNTYITDCLLHCCCSCCAIIQEAKHVETALQFGHEEVEVPEDRKRAEV